jgi:hypothetical protein
MSDYYEKSNKLSQKDLAQSEMEMKFKNLFSKCLHESGQTDVAKCTYFINIYFRHNAIQDYYSHFTH